MCSIKLKNYFFMTTLVNRRHHLYRHGLLKKQCTFYFVLQTCCFTHASMFFGTVLQMFLSSFSRLSEDVLISAFHACVRVEMSFSSSVFTSMAPVLTVRYHLQRFVACFQGFRGGLPHGRHLSWEQQVRDHPCFFIWNRWFRNWYSGG